MRALQHHLDVPVASFRHVVVACAGLVACGEAAPEGVSDGTERAAFVHVAAEAGLGVISPSASGCIVLDDLDRDGFDDAAWTVEDGPGVHLQLAWGTGPGTFGPATLVHRAGLPAFWGCVAVDIDRSGLPDLVIDGIGGFALFRQTAPREWAGEIVPAPQPTNAAYTALAVVDPDRDGWPDLFVVQSAQTILPAGSYNCVYLIEEKDVRCTPPKGLPAPLPPLVLANDHGVLRPAPDRVSVLPREPTFNPFAVGTADLDEDGLMDAVVAVDFGEVLTFRGTADGRFEEVRVPGTSRYAHGMGVAFGDVDGDCRLDLAVSDVGPTLLFTSGSGALQPAEVASGLADATRLGWGWGLDLFDADLDGDLDLYQSNLYTFPSLGSLLTAASGSVWVNGTPTPTGGGLIPGLEAPENDYLLLNDGAVHFKRQLLPDWYSIVPACVPLVAFSDVDRDGDLDVLQLLCDEVRLLRNDLPHQGTWLELALRGRASTLEGVGARVTVRAGDVRRCAQVAGAQGYVSWSSPVVHVGLGAVAGPVSIDVAWPSGCRQRLDAQPVNARIVIEEPEACP